MTFSELGVSEPLLRAIDELGFIQPMPVQETVIPHQLNTRQDLVALAQTGTGKTAAYGLPLLQRLAELGSNDSSNGSSNGSVVTRAIVLSPTRELCLQIADDLASFAKYLPQVKIMAVYGGANIEPQIRELRKGVDVIVATPGRLIDLMHRGAAKLDNVDTVVLDEADEMLSMGFSESIDAILEGVPAQHTTLLFSATMSKEIERIAQNYLHDAQQMVVGSRNEGAENVNHIYYMVRASDKYLALKRVVDYYPKIYAIVFCRTRKETQEVADHLIQDGYNADALHGDLSQQQRDLTMQRFRLHRIQLLVATDVAARGLDVDDLTHVINYGMPDDTENYTHRSGRTGRAGKKGTSICIVHSRERSKIREVEKTINKEFVQGTLPTPKEICTKQLWKVIDDIERVVVEEEEIEDFLPEVRRRLEWLDKDDLLKRMVSREFGRFLRYYAGAPDIEEVKPGNESGSRRGKKGERSSHNAEEGFTRLFITLGKVDGFYAKEIIGVVNKRCGGDKVEIGRIDLRPTFSFFEVRSEDAERVLSSLKGLTVKGRRIGVDVADDADSDSKRPSRDKAKGKASKDGQSKGKHSKRKDFKGGDANASGNAPKGRKNKGKKGSSQQDKEPEWWQFFQKHKK
ncbi:MAG: DEAD/DEAH box helicase [Bacteroidaceae bacterium]|nr:DEAD/DEAH box helicase [Bacteroidaceae bacterium]